MRDKHSPLLNAVTQQGETWRWVESSAYTGIPEVDSLSQTLIKDVYLDFDDILTGVLPYHLDLSSQATLEARLPSGEGINPRVSFKIRLGVNSKEARVIAHQKVDIDKN